MGLTRASTGHHIRKTEAITDSGDTVILLAGNPNVGKSTLFNRLTGMHQHTGNWSGKTVTTAVGYQIRGGKRYAFIDLPGCYSLHARSTEEEVAREGLCFSPADRVAIVCDASCLERNLTLVLQILEYRTNAVLCLNLMDEAARKGIVPDGKQLEEQLGIPVVTMSAARGKEEANKLLGALERPSKDVFTVRYPATIEAFLTDIEALTIGEGLTRRQARVLALRLLDSNRSFVQRLALHYGLSHTILAEAEALAERYRQANETDPRLPPLGDRIAEAIAASAALLAGGCVLHTPHPPVRKDRLSVDRLLAFPLMLGLLFLVLWLTIKGANLPSELLAALFARGENEVASLLTVIQAPPWLISLLCEGILRVVGWIVSVMLPPMAIFFPLFTILEDIGYLPRVAFNLDRCFKGCHACGKQALTMCMGLGCNAAGIVGCRIIDSPRERLLAILTNSFMPCNGRFPMLIAILGIFFSASGWITASGLALLILLAVLMTLGVSWLLSVTVFRGISSSFILELPPYRKPRIGQLLVRSLLDRTLFVLGRAVAVAVPTGALIWLLANLSVGNTTPLALLSDALEPLGCFLGLDGVILLGFLLGMPANEIVIPIILMCYLSGSSMTAYPSLRELQAILLANGWTSLTAINMLILTVFHWPCSTTILTIHKETGSLKQTVAALLIPTAIGFILCLTVRLTALLIA